MLFEEEEMKAVGKLVDLKGVEVVAMQAVEMSAGLLALAAVKM